MQVRFGLAQVGMMGDRGRVSQEAIDEIRCQRGIDWTGRPKASRSATWSRRQAAIDAEAALDGLYFIRTSLSEQRMDAPTCVHSHKVLSNVERAFRSLQTVDPKVRPIHHRLAERVRAHILLCMLACHVEWHMREAWAPLMFAVTDQAAKATRDPVASGGTSQALALGAAQGRIQADRRGEARAQLCHSDGGAEHARAQHLPHARRWRGCAELGGAHRRHSAPAARPGADPDHPSVVRKTNPEIHRKWLMEKETSGGLRRNFRPRS